MKTLIFSTAFTLCCLVSFGQKRSDLKGPAAKNYKPWKDKTVGTPLATKTDVAELSGPQAKNAKAWETTDTNLVPIKAIANKPKGIKAKNNKIWED